MPVHVESKKGAGKSAWPINTQCTIPAYFALDGMV